MYSKPSGDQLEMSVFGPGYGESIVVHIGNDQWIIIDSCYDKKKSKPAALAYLQEIGVDVQNNVKLIIATHWHDDHIRGLSACVDACVSAEFCCSMAFGKADFLEMLKWYDDDKTIASTTGTSEMSKVFDLIRERGLTPIKAMENRTIYTLPSGESGHGEECKVQSLSPSDKQVQMFLAGIKGMMPEDRATKKRAPSPSPNHLCVVTLIEVGDLTILLGGDHEETGDSETGWSVIVASANRPQKKATIYKIPHHGSCTADVPSVWSEMLIQQPYAVLTPFSRSGLPDKDMVETITSRAENSFTTATLNPSKSQVKRDRATERMIEQIVGGIRTTPNTGQVRLRSTGSGKQDEWSVELFAGACHLSLIRS